ncbi:MAG: isoprenylcysteine carboxylmethyltransferase family protein [Bacteroidetes bacterium]|nr:isoprenylcysteine carboxylmethyltransferase family protein [Bacteroidota bacterium]
MTLLVDTAVTVLWFSLFALVHSITASRSVKLAVAHSFPGFMPWYRLSYNALSLVTLYFFYSYSPKNGYTLYDLPTPLDLIFASIQFGSVLGLAWTFKSISGSEFMGFSQIIRRRRNEYRALEDLDEKYTLRIEGPYKFSRHPIYLFSIIFLLFRPQMHLDYFIMIILFIAYFFIGSIFEEKKLVTQFGEEYIQYQKTTGRIFPRLFKGTQIKKV